MQGFYGVEGKPYAKLCAMAITEVQPGNGEWLRFYRERAGLTQRELAAAAGISYVTVNHLENDRRMPSERVAKALARELRVKPRYLFPDDGMLTPSAVAEKYLKAYKRRRRSQS